MSKPNSSFSSIGITFRGESGKIGHTLRHCFKPFGINFVIWLRRTWHDSHAAWGKREKFGPILWWKSNFWSKTVIWEDDLLIWPFDELFLKVSFEINLMKTFHFDPHIVHFFERKFTCHLTKWVVCEICDFHPFSLLVTVSKRQLMHQVMTFNHLS